MEKENSKVDGSRVSQNIPELETIEQTNQKFQDAWVNYFKNLSPRIKIMFPGDEKFDFEKIKLNVAKLKRMDEEDIDKIIWPEEKISFLLSFNSSILEEENNYLIMDTFLFYFGDIAFSLGHFEIDSQIIDEGGAYTVAQYKYFDTYSLSDYSDDLLEWKFIAKLIKGRIVDLENKVPPLPENF